MSNNLSVDTLKQLVIPPAYRFASEADIAAMNTRLYVLIGLSLIVLPLWARLIYQEYTEPNESGNRFWLLAGIGVCGLIVFAMFYFLQLLTSELAMSTVLGVHLTGNARDYDLARQRFVTAFRWMTYVSLLFSVVSLGLVAQRLWNPLQYLPQYLQQYGPIPQKQTPRKNLLPNKK